MLIRTEAKCRLSGGECVIEIEPIVVKSPVEQAFSVPKFRRSNEEGGGNTPIRMGSAASSELAIFRRVFAGSRRFGSLVGRSAY